MKSFDEVVYCKTREEWDTVVDWADSDLQRESFKDDFDVYDDICVNHNKISNLLNYGSLNSHKYREEHYGKVITFQEFKDKYMKESEGTSQSPSEVQKFKSDGGSGMEGSQVKLLKQNIISFVNSVESVGCNPSELLTRNMELLEILSMNGLKLTLTKES